MMLSGATTATTTASSSGTYTFTGLASGTYTVTASHTGYTLNPSSQTVSVNGANLTEVNFTAVAQGPPTFTISGVISPAAGGSGATVTLSGAASSTATTSSSGTYTFAGLANGNYAVTPSHTGYTFSPASQNATINAANVTGVDFTATILSTHSVMLSWNASTSMIAGYNVYRSTVNGGGFTKLNSSLVTLLTYTDTTVQNGTTYFYMTTAVDPSDNESEGSNQASATIP
jgi:hypothetical protein